MRIPTLLKKEPLFEVLFELRFDSKVESVAEVLPGLLYSKLSKDYDNIVKLPASGIPADIRKRDPAFRYTPLVKLEGNKQFSVQIGEHVISLACAKPYSGWEKFGDEICRLMEHLKDTGLITNPERFSLKYIDIIELNESPCFGIAPLKVAIKLGAEDIVAHPVHLRTELEEDEYVHIIQIASPASVTLRDKTKLQGTIVDIDTVCMNLNTDFWGAFKKQLNKAHEINKEKFFNLLKVETIKALDPVYED